MQLTPSKADMKIAIVAPADETVPPVKYGGTELVIYNLVEGLVRKGHEVHLFASGDSVTSATSGTGPSAGVNNYPRPTRLRGSWCTAHDVS